MGKLCKTGIILLFALLLNTMAVLPQSDSLATMDDQPAVQGQMPVVSLRVETGQTTVPLNRTVDVEFVLEWYGGLDRIEILPFDNPILNNFDMVANSSSNTVTAVNGESRAVREYRFTLQPKAMGMGYVESAIIRYTDLATDTDYTLTTNRLPIKVTEPVPEPGDKTWILWLALVLIVVGGAAYVVVMMQKKAAVKREQERIRAEQERPIEEKILEQLKAEVNLNDTAMDITGGIDKVTRLTRRYIAQKFDIAMEGKASEEIVKALRALDVDEKYRNDLSEILTQGDIYKFSGGSASRQELERIFGLLENNLLKVLQNQTGTNS